MLARVLLLDPVLNAPESVELYIAICTVPYIKQLLLHT